MASQFYQAQEAHTEATPTQIHFLYNKQQRLDREAWGATGTLWELRDYPVEVARERHSLCPLYPHRWVGALSGCSGLPARSLQRVPRHIPGAHLGPEQRSKRDQPGSTTRTWPLHPELLQVLQASDPEAFDTHWTPSRLPRPPGTHSLHRGHFYIGQFSKTRRDTYFV